MNTQTQQASIRKRLLFAVISISTLILISLPQIAYGQDEEGGISGLVSAATDIVDQLIPLVASLTLLAFFWGLAKYIFNAGDEQAREQGKRVMIGGIIALFLIASVGGIVQFIADAFDLETGQGITPPTINLDTHDGVDTANFVYNKGDGIG